MQAELSNTLGEVTAQVRSNLNQTVQSVMANATEFLAFAEQGNFSSKVQTLPDTTNYIKYAFNTYTIASALIKSNIYAVIGKGTNPTELATNGTKIAYPIECTQGLDPQGVCDAWWYSTNYKSAFGLVSRDTPEMNYGDLQTKLFTNYTTGELLFEAAYECNNQGNHGGPVNITVTTAGVNTACISILDTYTWDMTCHDGVTRNVSGAKPCEYLEVGKQPGFWDPSVSDPNIVTVPAAYLGPAIAQDVVKITRS